jgi:hypothetical protein
MSYEVSINSQALLQKFQISNAYAAEFHRVDITSENELDAVIIDSILATALDHLVCYFSAQQRQDKWHPWPAAWKKLQEQKVSYIVFTNQNTVSLQFRHDRFKMPLKRLEEFRLPTNKKITHYPTSKFPKFRPIDFNSPYIHQKQDQIRALQRRSTVPLCTVPENNELNDG